MIFGCRLKKSFVVRQVCKYPILYLGIDQHARQITISLRDENGDVLQARQVSTQPERINDFFDQLTRERLRNGESFVAVLEVCGFNDWLIRRLQDYRCHKVILIQPDDRKKCKTDRRDAAALSELLWVNRDRLLQGKLVRGLRQVDIASCTDRGNRRLTTLRKDAGGARTRIINLANYWGLTPGCRNSGENNQRLGSITKAGRSTARWLLAQLVFKVLRRDARLREWFKRIKRRRGASIARVAVMRKLATNLWHMLSKRRTYAECRALAAA